MTGTWRKMTSPPYNQQQEALAQQQQYLSGVDISQGQNLINYLMTGTLPPGQQAQIDLQKAQADATSQGRFAGLGLGNSSMAASALGYNDLQAAALQATIEQALAELGVQLTGQGETALTGAETTYGNMATAQTQQEVGLEQAIAQFAGAVAGAASPKKTT